MSKDNITKNLTEGCNRGAALKFKRDKRLIVKDMRTSSELGLNTGLLFSSCGMILGRPLMSIKM